MSYGLKIHKLDIQKLESYCESHNIDYTYWNTDLLEEDEFIEIEFDSESNRDILFKFLYPDQNKD